VIGAAWTKAARHLVASHLMTHQFGDNCFNLMAIEGLSVKERDIVLRCMKATAAYIDDWKSTRDWVYKPRICDR
jgi:truncated hemoglobin YjbI